MKRLRDVPPIFPILACLASLYCWAVVISTVNHPGSIGIDYTALGADFMVFDAAIKLAIHREIGTLYDPAGITVLINRTFHAWLGSDLDFRPWLYQPIFLVLLLPFGALSYLPAYALFGPGIWGGCDLVLLVASAGLVLRRVSASFGARPAAWHVCLDPAGGGGAVDIGAGEVRSGPDDMAGGAEP